MSTKNENSKNNYYVYQDREGNFSDIRFERFAKIFKDAGYTIYKVIEI